MTITGIRAPLNIPTQQTIRVQSPLAADWSDSNYKITNIDTNKPAFDNVKDVYQFRFKQDDFVHTLRNLPLDLHCLDTRAGDLQTRFVNSKIRAIDHSTKGSVRPVQPGMCWQFDGASDLRRTIPVPISFPITLAVRFLLRDTAGNHVFVGVNLSGSSVRSFVILASSSNLFFVRRNTTAISTNIGAFSINLWTDFVCTFLTDTTAVTWHRVYNNSWGDWTKQNWTGLTSVTLPSIDTLLIGQQRLSSPGNYLDGFISRISYIPKLIPDPNDSFPLFSQDDHKEAISYVAESSGVILDISNNNLTAETGFITNLSSFYNQTGINDVESWANTVGYTLSDGSTYFSDASVNTLIPSGVLIPRNESNKNKVAAYTSRNTLANLEFTGRVPNDPVIFSPCGNFNGSTNYATKGSRLTSGAITQLSVASWIKTTGVGNDNTIVGEHTDTLPNRIWRITTDANDWFIQLSLNGSTADKFYQFNNISDGNWHHLTFTYDGTVGSGEVISYHNGKVVDPLKLLDSNLNALNDTDTHFAIAAVNVTGVPNRFFDGQISNVIVDDNVVWTNKQVSNLYSGVVPSSIIAHYPFVETASGIIHNAISNTGHLSLININESNFWSQTQDINDYLINNGGRWVRSFDGVDDQLNIPGLSLSATNISIRLLSFSDNQSLFTLSNTTGTSVAVSGNSLLFGGSLNPSNIKIDGVTKTAGEAGALINDQKWHLLTFDNTGTATNIRLGTDSSLFGQIYVSEFKVGEGIWDLTKTGPVAPDISSLLNHGSYSGTTSILVPGNIAGSISQGQNSLCRQTSDALYASFDGSTHYAKLNSRLTNNPVRKLSVGVWSQSSNTGISSTVAAEYTLAGNLGSWVISDADAPNWSVLLTQVGDLASNTKFYTGNIMANNIWHNLVFTYDGVVGSGELFLYEDGSLIDAIKGIDQSCTGLFNTTAPFSVGAIDVDATPLNLHSGNIAQVVVHEGAIWNAAQISGLYGGTIPDGAKSWNFTETQGTGLHGSLTLALSGSATTFWADNVSNSIMNLELADEPFSPYALAISGNRDSTVYRPGDNANERDPQSSVAARVNINSDDRLVVYRNLVDFNKKKVTDYTE